MPMPGNLTSFPQVFVWINANVGGYFGTLLPFAIWAVIFLSLKNYSTARALLASCFITSIITLTFVYMKVTPSVLLYVFFFGVVASAAYLLKGDDE